MYNKIWQVLLECTSIDFKPCELCILKSGKLLEHGFNLINAHMYIEVTQEFINVVELCGEFNVASIKITTQYSTMFRLGTVLERYDVLLQEV